MSALAPRPGGDPLVIAHRGASGEAPENTAAAFALAAERGADAVEIDARLTADGACVVMHDATLERTTDCREALPGRAPWRVAELTAAEVGRVTAGFHDGLAQAVPSLPEAVAQVRELSLGLLVELKAERDDGALERAVAAALRAGEQPPRLTHVAAFDPAALRRAAEAMPDVGRALILAWLVADEGVIVDVSPVTPGLAEPGRPLGALRDDLAAAGIGHLGLALLGTHGARRHDVDAATVTWLREGGVELNVVVDDAEGHRRAAAAGIRSVLTDDPGRLSRR